MMVVVVVKLSYIYLLVGRAQNICPPVDRSTDPWWEYVRRYEFV